MRKFFKSNHRLYLIVNGKSILEQLSKLAKRNTFHVYIIHYLYNYSMKYFKISIVFLLVCVSFAQNFLSNGAFDLPYVPRNFLADSRADSWGGELFEIYNYGGGLGFGQYLDIQNERGNGYIQQEIQLPCEAYYILTFYRKSSDTNFASHVIEIQWNGMFIARVTPDTTDVVKEQFELLGYLGKNILKIREVGVGDDYEGLLLDQLKLVKSNNLILKQKVFAVSFLASTPLNQFISFRYALLFADDLFLYSYDIVKYKGLLATIFSTVTTIEVLKFEVLDKFLGWMEHVDDVSDTQKKYYAKKLFVNIEGAFKIPVDAFFPYVIYTIPQTILTCVIFYFVFHMTKQFKISLVFRKFSFFKTILFKLLIEENIGYFAYICLGNMTELFSFSSFSKCYNLFSISVLFILLIYCLAFYLFIGKYLGKRSSYFIEGRFKHQINLMFLSFGLIRSFCRGAVHFFFRDQYGYQTAGLCIIQIITLAYYIYIQGRHRIFQKKIVYSLVLVYHFIFFVFNFVLYLNFKTKLSKTFDPVQQILIYSLIATTISASVCQLIPFKKCKQSFVRLSTLENENEQPQAVFGHHKQKQEVLTKYLTQQTHKQAILKNVEDQQKYNKGILSVKKSQGLKKDKSLKLEQSSRPLMNKKVKGQKAKKGSDVGLKIQKMQVEQMKQSNFKKSSKNVQKAQINKQDFNRDAQIPEVIEQNLQMANKK